MSSIDSFKCRRRLPGFDNVWFMSLPEAERNGAGPISRLPYSLRVLAEILLRREDGATVSANQIRAVTRAALPSGAVGEVPEPIDIAYFPGRIMLQESSGIPVLADIAALEEALNESGGAKIETPLATDIIVDHSVEVDRAGSATAASENLVIEFERNHARYLFLKWAERRFPWLRVVPPGTGICHQMNLEVLASVVSLTRDGERTMAGCDSLVGTDSHTTMVNALGVFGWGVGGIEATSAILNEPIALAVPEVVGIRLVGRTGPGIMATDIALSLTAMLREHDLVLRIAEFCGPGVDTLSIPDRATIANMAPEYGATMGFFPADETTLGYLRQTGRPEADVALTEAFLAAQGLLRDRDVEPVFSKVLEFDLSAVTVTIAGPSKPHQRLTSATVPETAPAPVGRQGLDHGHVVIAAITSCTNTSNPRLLVAAGLLARNAVRRGIAVKPWVKTSFAPGSRVSSGLLAASGLQASLDHLGFQIVGHGCTTCMGNSGPIDEALTGEIAANDLSVAAVISGNRNFEGRIHPSARLVYLASPPLVIAYALAGTVKVDVSRDSLGTGVDDKPVYLSQIWPTEQEIDDALASANIAHLAKENRRTAFDGPEAWRALAAPDSRAYAWEGETGFVRKPPFMSKEVARPQLSHDIIGARALVMLGDGITTDYISPVSRIPPTSAAGRWLTDHDIKPKDFGSYSGRRLNHEVMLRGGFANLRLRNALVEIEGGYTRLASEPAVLPIHEAAAIYRSRGVPMVVIAGAGYGAGSARDWAAKATRLLGVCAVMAESFERIHRTNLVALGVLPLQITRAMRLGLDGSEKFDIAGLPQGLVPHGEVMLTIHRSDGTMRQEAVHCWIETKAEAEWLRVGGILPKVFADIIVNSQHAAE